MKKLIERIVVSSVKNLFKNQPDIMIHTSETGMTEWNLGHHLANEISKYIFWLDNDNDVTKRNLENHRPDMIFHKRGSMLFNFLVVELKRNNSIDDDIEKINEDWLSEYLHYRFGVAINLIFPDKFEGVLIDQNESTPLDFNRESLNFPDKGEYIHILKFLSELKEKNNDDGRYDLELNLFDLIIYKSFLRTNNEITILDEDFDNIIKKFDLTKSDFSKMDIDDLLKIDIPFLKVKPIFLPKIKMLSGFSNNGYNFDAWALRTLKLFIKENNFEEKLQNQEYLNIIAFALASIWNEYDFFVLNEYSDVDWDEKYESIYHQIVVESGHEFSDDLLAKIRTIENMIYHVIDNHFDSVGNILDFFYDDPENIKYLLDEEKEMEREIEELNERDGLEPGELGELEKSIRDNYFFIDELDEYRRFLRISDHEIGWNWLLSHFHNVY